MAVPLSTISYSNTFQPNKHPNIFPKQSQNNRNLTLSLLSNPFIRTTNLSPPQSPVAVSAVSGSPGIDASVVSEDTGSLLDSVQVFDLNGNSVPISDLWKDRKAVVAFARHFGCVLCRKRADCLAAKKEIMDAASVALVLIGPGSVDQICVAAIHSTCKTKGESQVGIGAVPAKYPPTLK